MAKRKRRVITRRNVTAPAPAAAPTTVVVHSGGSDTSTLIFMTILLAGGGLAAWYFLKQGDGDGDKLEAGEISANPGAIGVGENTTLSIDVKNPTKISKRVSVRFEVFEAGSWLYGKFVNGDRIDVTTTPVQIMSTGVTKTFITQHTGSVGGPTNSGIAMRHVEATILVDGVQVGGTVENPDCFGVQVGGESVGFNFGTATAIPTQGKNGSTVTFKIPVTNMSSNPYTLWMALEIHEAGFYNPGDLYGSIHNLPAMTFSAGETREFIYDWQVAGVADSGVTLVGTLYYSPGTEKTPNTKPNNPYQDGSFKNLFRIISPIINFEYPQVGNGTIVKTGESVSTPVLIKNKSTESKQVYVIFQPTEASWLGRGTNVGPSYQSGVVTLNPEQSYTFNFTWTSSGNNDTKDAYLTIVAGGLVWEGEKRMAGIAQQIPEQYNDYTLIVTTNPAGKMFQYKASAEAFAPWGNPVSYLSVQKVANSAVCLKTTDPGFLYWEGLDMGGGAGNDYSNPMITAMPARNVNIVAVFSGTGPSIVSFTIDISNLTVPRTYWLVRHYTALGAQDFDSGPKPIYQAINISNVAAEGYIVFYLMDAGSQWDPGVRCDTFTAEDGAWYTWVYDTGQVFKVE